MVWDIEGRSAPKLAFALLTIALFYVVLHNQTLRAEGYDHEPTGFTVIAEYDASAIPPSDPPRHCASREVLSGCWFDSDPNGTHSLVSVSTAPRSPQGVFQFKVPAGQQPGIGAGMIEGWDSPETRPNQFSAVYESGWVRVPTSTFEMQAVSVKFLGYAGVGEAYPTNINPVQMYFGSDNWSGTGDAAVLSETNVDLFQAGAGVDRRIAANVVTDRVFTFGTWHHYEFVMVLNDIGVANGTFKMWWNGTLISDHTDIAYRNSTYPSGFFGRRFHLVWGGQGGSNHSRDDYVEWDHIYMSGVKCSSPGSRCAAPVVALRSE